MTDKWEQGGFEALEFLFLVYFILKVQMPLSLQEGLGEHLKGKTFICLRTPLSPAFLYLSVLSGFFLPLVKIVTYIIA